MKIGMKSFYFFCSVLFPLNHTFNNIQIYFLSLFQKRPIWVFVYFKRQAFWRSFISFLYVYEGYPQANMNYFIILLIMRNNKAFPIVLISFFLALGFASSSSSTYSYAPLPAINSTMLFTLNDLTADANFIGSKRIESLQLSTTILPNTSTATVFSLNFFNRTNQNNLNSYNFTQLGNWVYVAGTKESLSCSLVYEPASQTFGLMQFLQDAGSFKMLAIDPVSNLPTVIQGLIASVPLESMSNFLYLGQNCIAGYFASPAGSVLYYLNPDYTDLSIVPVPSGFTIQAAVQSFQYAIASNLFYKIDVITKQYNQIYSFPTSLDYTISMVANRIIITAANYTSFTTSGGSTRYAINETIYFFVDDTTNGLTLIAAQSISGTGQNQRFQIFTSPQLTKLGFSYTPVNSNDTFVVAKSVDYANKQVFDLIPQDFTHLLTTMRGSRPGFFDISDYYMIARNDSNLPLNPTGQAVEEAYQFVGNQIVFFRARNLTAGREIDNFARIFVDPFFPSQLVVLDVYSTKNSSTNAVIGYQVVQYNYGTIASMSMPVPQGLPHFINFIVPANTNAIASTILEWAYYSVNASALTTALYYFRANRSAANNLIIQNYTLPGLWSLVANNPSCSLGKDTTNNYVLYQTVDNNLGPLADLTPIASALGITAIAAWRISQNCDRFAVGQQIFSFSQANPSLFQPITNSIATFAWSSIDDNLTTAVVGSQVWRYKASQNSFVLLFDTFTTIHPTSSIKVLQNAVIITATSSTSAQVLAFSLSSSGTAINCLNYSLTGFSSTPKIQVSENLTKVLIIGPFSQTGGTISPKADMFFIDYANAQSQTITFPLSAMDDPLYTYISLNEKFLYIRQLQNPSIPYNISSPNQEFVYCIIQDLYPQMTFTSNIDPTRAQVWTRTLIQTTPDGNTYVMQQILQGNASVALSVVVTQRQITATQASINSNINQGVTGYMNNGKITLCSPGCSDCSTGTCTACITAFAFDYTASICHTCGLNCVACISSNPNNCSSCMAGAYLSGSTCLPCSTSCITCSGSANSCSQCSPGQYFQSTQCAICPNNCDTCSSQNICTQCNNGYVLTSVNVCRRCIASCSNCSPSNITQCTSCAYGLQLSGGSCIQCPLNCLSCNKGACATCAPGFTHNSYGVCVLNCQLPCATCSDNQPTNCLSCYGNATLTNNTCSIDTSCNSISSCTNCGQGQNYILIVGQCLPCSQITNCLQCSAANSQICAICSIGYFVNGTIGCGMCPTQCIFCTSADICTACVVGYTLSNGQNQGQCLQCQSPCATCIGSPTYCASCVTGFTKNGWRCRNNTYVSFTINLGDSPENILSNIDAIVVALLKILGLNQTNVSAITFTKIKSGSTLLTGDTSSSSGPVLSTGLAVGSLAGYPINSVSVTSYKNGEAEDDQQSQSSSSKMKLIIGLSILIPVVVIIIVIIIYCIYRRKDRTSNVRVAPNVEVALANITNISIDEGTNSIPDGLEANIVEKQFVSADGAEENSAEKKSFA